MTTKPAEQASSSSSVVWEYVVSAGVSLVVLALVFWPLAAPESAVPAASFAQEVENGLGALRRGDHTAAVEHFTAAVAIDPSSPVGHLDLGIALLGAGRHAEAIPACEKAVALAPANLDARHNLGFANLMAGQHATAVRILEDVVRADGSRAVTWYELGRAYVAVGASDQARASFEKALALEPGHGRAQQQLAELGATAEATPSP